MAYQRFSLFPDSPSFKDLFSARSLRYRWRNGDPVITTAIMAICIVVWAIEAVLFLVWPEGGNAFVNAGMLLPATAVRHPWTFITSMFLHQPTSLWHILFNMLTLWCVGPVLERMMGHWPYLALYLLSGLGGGAGLMVWAVCSPSGWMTAAYGASGALFGLFAAILVVYRRIGIDIRSMLIWMLINFLMPVITPGIAWQAHVGGFIVGGVLAWLLVTGLHAFRGKSLTWRIGIASLSIAFVILSFLWITSGQMWMNVDNAHILCLSQRRTTKYRRRFPPFLWGVDIGYPQFSHRKFLMFRHFVNILVDNPPRYPRLTHRSDLTYPQSYPRMWKTTCV